MIGSIGDLVTFSYVRRMQLVSDASEPVICIEWLNGMMEGGWFQTNEVGDRNQLLTLMCGVLLNLCKQAVSLTLVPLGC